MKNYLQLLTGKLVDVLRDARRIARRRLTLELFKKGVAVTVCACLLVNIAQVGVFAETKRPIDVIEEQKSQDNMFVPGSDNSPAAVMGGATYSTDENNALMKNGEAIGYVDPANQKAYMSTKEGWKENEEAEKQLFGTGQQGNGQTQTSTGQNGQQSNVPTTNQDQNANSQEQSQQNGQQNVQRQQEQDESKQPEIETYKQDKSDKQQDQQKTTDEEVAKTNDGIQKAGDQKTEEQKITGKKRDEGSESVVNMLQIQKAAADHGVVLIAENVSNLNQVVGSGYVVAHFTNKKTGQGMFATIAPDGQMNYTGANGEIVVTTLKDFQAKGEYKFTNQVLVTAKDGVKEDFSSEKKLAITGSFAGDVGYAGATHVQLTMVGSPQPTTVEGVIDAVGSALDAVYNSLANGIALTDDQKSFLDSLGITAESLGKLLTEKGAAGLKEYFGQVMTYLNDHKGQIINCATEAMGALVTTVQKWTIALEMILVDVLSGNFMSNQKGDGVYASFDAMKKVAAANGVKTEGYNTTFEGLMTALMKGDPVTLYVNGNHIINVQMNKNPDGTISFSVIDNGRTSEPVDAAGLQDILSGKKDAVFGKGTKDEKHQRYTWGGDLETTADLSGQDHTRKLTDQEMRATAGAMAMECCFAAGTLVVMADGTRKPIEAVKVGEALMGYDGKRNVAGVVTELVQPVRDHLYVVVFEDGSEVRLTKDHPLYTVEGWKSIDPEGSIYVREGLAVGVLQVGDRVQKSDGSYAKIVSMEYLPGRVQTYSFKVTVTYNYYANGFLAHNCGGGGGTTSSNTGGSDIDQQRAEQNEARRLARIAAQKAAEEARIAAQKAAEEARLKAEEARKAAEEARKAAEEARIAAQAAKEAQKKAIAETDLKKKLELQKEADAARKKAEEKIQIAKDLQKKAEDAVKQAREKQQKAKDTFTESMKLNPATQENAEAGSKALADIAEDLDAATKDTTDTNSDIATAESDHNEQLQLQKDAMKGGGYDAIVFDITLTAAQKDKAIKTIKAINAKTEKTGKGVKIDGSQPLQVKFNADGTMTFEGAAVTYIDKKQGASISGHFFGTYYKDGLDGKIVVDDPSKAKLNVDRPQTGGKSEPADHDSTAQTVAEVTGSTQDVFNLANIQQLGIQKGEAKAFGAGDVATTGSIHDGHVVTSGNVMITGDGYVSADISGVKDGKGAQAGGTATVVSKVHGSKDTLLTLTANYDGNGVTSVNTYLPKTVAGEKFKIRSQYLPGMNGMSGIPLIFVADKNGNLTCAMDPGATKKNGSTKITFGQGKQGWSMTLNANGTTTGQGRVTIADTTKNTQGQKVQVTRTIDYGSGNAPVTFKDGKITNGAVTDITDKKTYVSGSTYIHEVAATTTDTKGTGGTKYDVTLMKGKADTGKVNIHGVYNPQQIASVYNTIKLLGVGGISKIESVPGVQAINVTLTEAGKQKVVKQTGKSADAAGSSFQIDVNTAIADMASLYNAMLPPAVALPSAVDFTVNKVNNAVAIDYSQGLVMDSKTGMLYKDDGNGTYTLIGLADSKGNIYKVTNGMMTNYADTSLTKTFADFKRQTEQTAAQIAYYSPQYSANYQSSRAYQLVQNMSTTFLNPTAIASFSDVNSTKATIDAIMANPNLTGAEKSLQSAWVASMATGKLVNLEAWSIQGAKLFSSALNTVLAKGEAYVTDFLTHNVSYFDTSSYTVRQWTMQMAFFGIMVDSLAGKLNVDDPLKLSTLAMTYATGGNLQTSIAWSKDNLGDIKDALALGLTVNVTGASGITTLGPDAFGAVNTLASSGIIDYIGQDAFDGKLTYDPKRGFVRSAAINADSLIFAPDTAGINAGQTTLDLVIANNGKLTVTGQGGTVITGWAYDNVGTQHLNGELIDVEFAIVDGKLNVVNLDFGNNDGTTFVVNKGTSGDGPTEGGELPEVNTKGVITETDTTYNISGSGSVISMRGGNWTVLGNGAEAWAGSTLQVDGVPVHVVGGTYTYGASGWTANSDASGYTISQSDMEAAMDKAGFTINWNGYNPGATVYGQPISTSLVGMVTDILGGAQSYQAGGRKVTITASKSTSLNGVNVVAGTILEIWNQGDKKGVYVPQNVTTLTATGFLPKGWTTASYAYSPEANIWYYQRNELNSDGSVNLTFHGGDRFGVLTDPGQVLMNASDIKWNGKTFAAGDLQMQVQMQDGGDVKLTLIKEANGMQYGETTTFDYLAGSQVMIEDGKIIAVNAILRTKDAVMDKSENEGSSSSGSAGTPTPYAKDGTAKTDKGVVYYSGKIYGVNELTGLKSVFSTGTLSAANSDVTWMSGSSHPELGLISDGDLRIAVDSEGNATITAASSKPYWWDYANHDESWGVTTTKEILDDQGKPTGEVSTSKYDTGGLISSKLRIPAGCALPPEIAGVEGAIVKEGSYEINYEVADHKLTKNLLAPTISADFSAEASFKAGEVTYTDTITPKIENGKVLGLISSYTRLNADGTTTDLSVASGNAVGTGIVVKDSNNNRIVLDFGDGSATVLSQTGPITASDYSGISYSARNAQGEYLTFTEYQGNDPDGKTVTWNTLTNSNQNAQDVLRRNQPDGSTIDTILDSKQKVASPVPGGPTEVTVTLNGNELVVTGNAEGDAAGQTDRYLMTDFRLPIIAAPGAGGSGGSVLSALPVTVIHTVAGLATTSSLDKFAMAEITNRADRQGQLWTKATVPGETTGQTKTVRGVTKKVKDGNGGWNYSFEGVAGDDTTVTYTYNKDAVNPVDVYVSGNKVSLDADDGIILHGIVRGGNGEINAFIDVNKYDGQYHVLNDVERGDIESAKKQIVNKFIVQEKFIREDDLSFDADGVMRGIFSFEKTEYEGPAYDGVITVTSIIVPGSIYNGTISRSDYKEWKMELREAGLGSTHISEVSFAGKAANGDRYNYTDQYGHSGYKTERVEEYVTKTVKNNDGSQKEVSTGVNGYGIRVADGTATTRTREYDKNGALKDGKTVYEGYGGLTGGDRWMGATLTTTVTYNGDGGSVITYINGTRCVGDAATGKYKQDDNGQFVTEQGNYQATFLTNLDGTPKKLTEMRDGKEENAKIDEWKYEDVEQKDNRFWNPEKEKDVKWDGKGRLVTKTTTIGGKKVSTNEMAFDGNGNLRAMIETPYDDDRAQMIENAYFFNADGTLSTGMTTQEANDAMFSDDPESKMWGGETMGRCYINGECFVDDGYGGATPLKMLNDLYARNGTTAAKCIPQYGLGYANGEFQVTIGKTDGTVVHMGVTQDMYASVTTIRSYTTDERGVIISVSNIDLDETGVQYVAGKGYQAKINADIQLQGFDFGSNTWYGKGKGTDYSSYSAIGSKDRLVRSVIVGGNSLTAELSVKDGSIEKNSQGGDYVKSVKLTDSQGNELDDYKVERGIVVVKDGKVVAKGWWDKYGWNILKTAIVIVVSVVAAILTAGASLAVTALVMAGSFAFVAATTIAIDYYGEGKSWGESITDGLVSGAVTALTIGVGRIALASAQAGQTVLAAVRTGAQTAWQVTKSAIKIGIDCYMTYSSAQAAVEDFSKGNIGAGIVDTLMAVTFGVGVGNIIKGFEKAFSWTKGIVNGIRGVETGAKVATDLAKGVTEGAKALSETEKAIAEGTKAVTEAGKATSKFKSFFNGIGKVLKAPDAGLGKLIETTNGWIKDAQGLKWFGAQAVNRLLTGVRMGLRLGLMSTVSGALTQMATNLSDKDLGKQDASGKKHDIFSGITLQSLWTSFKMGGIAGFLFGGIFRNKASQWMGTNMDGTMARYSEGSVDEMLMARTGQVEVNSGLGTLLKQSLESATGIAKFNALPAGYLYNAAFSSVLQGKGFHWTPMSQEQYWESVRGGFMFGMFSGPLFSMAMPGMDKATAKFNKEEAAKAASKASVMEQTPLTVRSSFSRWAQRTRATVTKGYIKISDGFSLGQQKLTGTMADQLFGGVGMLGVVAKYQVASQAGMWLGDRLGGALGQSVDRTGHTALGNAFAGLSFFFVPSHVIETPLVNRTKVRLATDIKAAEAVKNGGSMEGIKSGSGEADRLREFAQKVIAGKMIEQGILLKPGWDVKEFTEVTMKDEKGNDVSVRVQLKPDFVKMVNNIIIRSLSPRQIEIMINGEKKSGKGEAMIGDSFVLSDEAFSSRKNPNESKYTAKTVRTRDVILTESLLSDAAEVYAASLGQMELRDFINARTKATKDASRTDTQKTGDAAVLKAANDMIEARCNAAMRAIFAKAKAGDRLPTSTVDLPKEVTIEGKKYELRDKQTRDRIVELAKDLSERTVNEYQGIMATQRAADLLTLKADLPTLNEDLTKANKQLEEATAKNDSAAIDAVKAKILLLKNKIYLAGAQDRVQSLSGEAKTSMQDKINRAHEEIVRSEMQLMGEQYKAQRCETAYEAYQAERTIDNLRKLSEAITDYEAPLLSREALRQGLKLGTVAFKDGALTAKFEVKGEDGIIRTVTLENASLFDLVGMGAKLSDLALNPDGTIRATLEVNGTSVPLETKSLDTKELMKAKEDLAKLETAKAPEAEIEAARATVRDLEQRGYRLTDRDFGLLASKSSSKYLKQLIQAEAKANLDARLEAKEKATEELQRVNKEIAEISNDKQLNKAEAKARLDALEANKNALEKMQKRTKNEIAKEVKKGTLNDLLNPGDFLNRFRILQALTPEMRQLVRASGDFALTDGKSIQFGLAGAAEMVAKLQKEYGEYITVKENDGKTISIEINTDLLRRDFEAYKKDGKTNKDKLELLLENLGYPKENDAVDIKTWGPDVIKRAELINQDAKQKDSSRLLSYINDISYGAGFTVEMSAISGKRAEIEKLKKNMASTEKAEAELKALQSSLLDNVNEAVRAKVQANEIPSAYKIMLEFVKDAFTQSEIYGKTGKLRVGQLDAIEGMFRGENIGYAMGGGKTMSATVDAILNRVLLGKFARLEILVGGGGIENYTGGDAQKLTNFLGLEIVDAAQLQMSENIEAIIDAYADPNKIVAIDPTTRGHLITNAAKEGNTALLDALNSVNRVVVDEIHNWATSTTACVIGDGGTPPSPESVEDMYTLASRFKGIYDNSAALNKGETVELADHTKVRRFDTMEQAKEILGLNDEIIAIIGKGSNKTIRMTERAYAKYADVKKLSNKESFTSAEISSVISGIVSESSSGGMKIVKVKIVNGRTVEAEANDNGPDVKELVKPMSDSGVEYNMVLSDISRQMGYAFKEGWGRAELVGDAALIDFAARTTEVSKTSIQASLSSIYGRMAPRMVGMSGTILGLEQLIINQVGTGKIYNISAERFHAGDITDWFDAVKHAGEINKCIGKGLRDSDSLLFTAKTEPSLTQIQEIIKKIAPEALKEGYTIYDYTTGKKTRWENGEPKIEPIKVEEKINKLAGDKTAKRIIISNEMGMTGVDYQGKFKLLSWDTDLMSETNLSQLVKRVGRPIKGAMGERWECERYIITDGRSLDAQIEQFKQDRAFSEKAGKLWGGEQEAFLKNDSALKLMKNVQEGKNISMAEKVDFVAKIQELRAIDASARFAVRDVLQDRMLLSPLRTMLQHLPEGATRTRVEEKMAEVLAKRSQDSDIVMKEVTTEDPQKAMDNIIKSCYNEALEAFKSLGLRDTWASEYVRNHVQDLQLAKKNYDDKKITVTRDKGLRDARSTTEFLSSLLSMQDYFMPMTTAEPFRRSEAVTVAAKNVKAIETSVQEKRMTVEEAVTAGKALRPEAVSAAYARGAYANPALAAGVINQKSKNDQIEILRRGLLSSSDDILMAAMASDEELKSYFEGGKVAQDAVKTVRARLADVPAAEPQGIEAQTRALEPVYASMVQYVQQQAAALAAMIGAQDTSKDGYKSIAESVAGNENWENDLLDKMITGLPADAASSAAAKALTGYRDRMKAYTDANTRAKTYYENRVKHGFGIIEAGKSMADGITAGWYGIGLALSDWRLKRSLNGITVGDLSPTSATAEGAADTVNFLMRAGVVRPRVSTKAWKGIGILTQEQTDQLQDILGTKGAVKAFEKAKVTDLASLTQLPLTDSDKVAGKIDAMLKSRVGEWFRKQIGLDPAAAKTPLEVMQSLYNAGMDPTGVLRLFSPELAKKLEQEKVTNAGVNDILTAKTGYAVADLLHELDKVYAAGAPGSLEALKTILALTGKLSYAAIDRLAGNTKEQAAVVSVMADFADSEKASEKDKQYVLEKLGEIRANEATDQQMRQYIDFRIQIITDGLLNPAPAKKIANRSDKLAKVLVGAGAMLALIGGVSLAVIQPLSIVASKMLSSKFSKKDKDKDKEGQAPKINFKQQMKDSFLGGNTKNTVLMGVIMGVGTIASLVGWPAGIFISAIATIGIPAVTALVSLLKGAKSNKDKESIPATIETLLKVIEVSPDLLKSMGADKLKRFDAYVKKHKDDTKTKIGLAHLYATAGDKERALELLAEAGKTLGEGNAPALLKGAVIRDLYTMGDINKLAAKLAEVKDGQADAQAIARALGFIDPSYDKTKVAGFMEKYGTIVGYSQSKGEGEAFAQSLTLAQLDDKEIGMADMGTDDTARMVQKTADDAAAKFSTRQAKISKDLSSDVEKIFNPAKMRKSNLRNQIRDVANHYKKDGITESDIWAMYLSMMVKKEKAKSLDQALAMVEAQEGVSLRPLFGTKVASQKLGEKYKEYVIATEKEAAYKEVAEKVELSLTLGREFGLKTAREIAREYNQEKGGYMVSTEDVWEIYSIVARQWDKDEGQNETMKQEKLSSLVSGSPEFQRELEQSGVTLEGLQTWEQRTAYNGQTQDLGYAMFVAFNMQSPDQLKGYKVSEFKRGLSGESNEATVQTPQGESVTLVTNGTYVVTIRTGSSVKVFDLQTGQPLSEVKGSFDAVEFSRAGNTAAVDLMKDGKKQASVYLEYGDGENVKIVAGDEKELVDGVVKRALAFRSANPHAQINTDAASLYAKGIITTQEEAQYIDAINAELSKEDSGFALAEQQALAQELSMKVGDQEETPKGIVAAFRNFLNKVKGVKGTFTFQQVGFAGAHARVFKMVPAADGTAPEMLQGRVVKQVEKGQEKSVAQAYLTLTAEDNGALRAEVAPSWAEVVDGKVDVVVQAQGKTMNTQLWEAMGFDVDEQTGEPSKTGLPQTGKKNIAAARNVVQQAVQHINALAEAGYGYDSSLASSDLLDNMGTIDGRMVNFDFPNLKAGVSRGETVKMLLASVNKFVDKLGIKDEKLKAAVRDGLTSPIRREMVSLAIAEAVSPESASLMEEYRAEGTTPARRGAITRALKLAIDMSDAGSSIPGLTVQKMTRLSDRTAKALMDYAFSAGEMRTESIEHITGVTPPENMNICVRAALQLYHNTDEMYAKLGLDPLTNHPPVEITAAYMHESAIALGLLENNRITRDQFDVDIAVLKTLKDMLIVAQNNKGAAGIINRDPAKMITDTDVSTLTEMINKNNKVNGQVYLKKWEDQVAKQPQAGTGPIEVNIAALQKAVLEKQAEGNWFSNMMIEIRRSLTSSEERTLEDKMKDVLGKDFKDKGQFERMNSKILDPLGALAISNAA